MQSVYESRRKSIKSLSSKSKKIDKISLTCNLCDLTFKKRNSLMSHYKLHFDFSSLHCIVCNEILSNVESFNHHIETHVDNAAFKCEICGLTFSNQSKLKLHKHSELFVCKFCDRKFVRKLSLTLHMKYHSRDGMFNCLKCEESFPNKTRLNIHSMIHSDEKPFTCGSCNKGFRLKANLKKHEGTHLPKGPFICNICGEEFSRLASLTMHKKVHNRSEKYEYIGGPNNQNIREDIAKTQQMKGEKNQVQRINFDHETGVLCYSIEDLDDLEDIEIPNKKMLTISSSPTLEESIYQSNILQNITNTSSTSLDNIGPLTNLDTEGFESLALTFNHDSTHDLPETFTLYNEEINELFNSSKIDKTIAQTEQPISDSISLISNKNFMSGKDFIDITLHSNNYDKIDTQDKQSIFHIPAQSLIDDNVEIVATNSKQVPESTGSDPLVDMYDQLNNPDVNQLSDAPLDSMFWNNTTSDMINRVVIPGSNTLCDQNTEDLKPNPPKNLKKTDTKVKTVKEKKCKKEEKVYICNICKKDCKTSSMYHVHVRHHTGERPYSCDVCKASFRQLAHLKSHALRHSGERPYKCKECGKGFTQISSMKVHVKRVHSKPKKTKEAKVRKKHTNFYCKYCDETFIGTCFRVDHMEQHKERKYLCDACDYKADKKSDLKNHILTFHKIQVNIESNNSSLKHETNSSLEGVEESEDSIISAAMKDACRYDVEYECRHCSKTFYHKSSLATHIKRSCDIKRFKCNKCDMRFQNVSHLKDHTIRHAGVKPFMCDTCFRTFYTKHGGNVHIKKHHNNTAKIIQVFDLSSGLQLDDKELISIDPCKNKSETLIIKVSQDNDIIKSVTDNETLHDDDYCHPKKVSKNSTMLDAKIKIEPLFDNTTDNLSKSNDVDTNILSQNSSAESDVKIEYEDSEFECSVELIPNQTKVCEDFDVPITDFIITDEYSNSNMQDSENLSTLFYVLSESNNTVLYGCKFCQGQSLSYSQLFDHYEFHSSGYYLSGTINCPLEFCDKEYSNIKLLQNHLRNIKSHSKLPIYTCKHCNNDFHSETILNDHRKDCDYTSYKCKTCAEIFSDLCFLKIHKCSSNNIENQYVKTKFAKVDIACDKKTKSFITSALSFEEPDFSKFLSKDNSL